MLIDLLLLVAGLAILVGGGEALVRGASCLARGLGVPPIAIGLTVVAFGTSAPELAVNVGAALRGSSDLSFGNVFGSNMANIGIIIAVIAMLKPLPVHGILIRRELPMMLLALAAAMAAAFDQLLRGEPDVIDRTDGVILLLFFVVFLYYTVGDLIRRRDGNAESEFAASGMIQIDDDSEEPVPHMIRDCTFVIFGLAGLIGGSEMAVTGATGVARGIGIPEVVIGLTLVSIGTSLPELVAGIIAVRHDKCDMAVGSVVGSNIFNTLLVAGATATLHPIAIPAGGHLDLAVTALLSLLLTLTASTHRQSIIRAEGIVLMLIYVAYMSWRTLAY